MAGLFGGGGKKSSSKPDYTGLQLQTSAHDVPIPILWGVQRVSPNLFWYGDFKAVEQKTSVGKGGGGDMSTGYKYYASVALGLCEGPIDAIEQIWANQDLTNLELLNLSVMTGTSNQQPISWMTTNHPDQALSYPYTAYLFSPSYDLGGSASLPQHTFEVRGPRWGQSVNGSPDVCPAYFLVDYLTSDQYGAGMTTDQIGDLTSWENYCICTGILMSPLLSSQEQASQVIDRWAQLTNTWIFWNGLQLKAVPLGDTAMTRDRGFSTPDVRTYTPNSNPLFDLTLDDFLYEQGVDPVEVDRSDPTDAYNSVKLEISDRNGRAYESNTIEWRDQAAIDSFGYRPAPSIQAREICDPGIGMNVATLIGQRGLYIRNTYTFKVSSAFIVLLEPGDVVTLTEPHIGLDRFPVKIRELDEDDIGHVTITAEEFPAGIGTAAVYDTQAVSGYALNTNAAPGSVNTPAIYEPTSSSTGGTGQVWIALSGSSPNWGGADIYVSTDGGNTYTRVGTSPGKATQGVLTANLADGADPDSTNTLSVDLTESAGTLSATITHQEADALQTLSLVDGEMLAFGSVSVGASANHYDLTYLRRGVYASGHTAHASGAPFAVLDAAVFKYSYPKAYANQQIFLKFPSYNIWGGAFQDLSECTAYEFTPSGRSFADNGTITSGSIMPLVNGDTPVGIITDSSGQAVGVLV